MTRKFRLAVVLRLRQLDEDAARAKLGEAIAQRIAAVSARDAVERRLAAEHAWLSQLQGVSAAAGELQAACRTVAGAESARIAAEQQVAVSERGVLEARARLAQASKRREVVERLRDRHLAAERQRAEHAEIVRLADVAAVQHLWQHAGETGR
jgi:flagellar protein FliJ